MKNLKYYIVIATSLSLLLTVSVVRGNEVANAPMTSTEVEIHLDTVEQTEPNVTLPVEETLADIEEYFFEDEVVESTHEIASYDNFYEEEVKDIEEVEKSLKTKVNEPCTPHYRVNGSQLDISLQDYVYDLLVKQFGVPKEYFPLWLAQLYQENKYQHSSSMDGLDYGYCQLRIRFHNELAVMSGCWTTDLINDPYANLYVGTWLIAHRFHEYGDWNTAVMYYFNSGDYSSNLQYLRDVSQWYSTIERIEE